MQVNLNHKVLLLKKMKVNLSMKRLTKNLQDYHSNKPKIKFSKSLKMKLMANPSRNRMKNIEKQRAIKKLLY